MKWQMSLVVPSAVAVVLILLTTLVQGFLTDRWGATTSDQMEGFLAVYRELPQRIRRIGDWELQDTTDMDPREREAAGAMGDFSATYRNPHTQEQVSVYMICGPSRAVAVHTPDACYVSSGFRMEEKIRPYDISFRGGTGEFRTATFLKEDPTTTQLVRVFWAWNADGHWEAPEAPRLKYGGRTPLNKIYFITRASPNEPIEESPALAFAKEFLPGITPLLFGHHGPEMAHPSPEKTEPKESSAPEGSDSKTSASIPSP